MDRVIMTEEKFHRLMSYYIEERNHGKLKYMWEISVPDKEYDYLLWWLEECERLGFIFAFAVIERYNGHKLMYGFSDFEIPERDNMKLLEINFENSDIMYQYFMDWHEESAYFVLPSFLKTYMEIMKRETADD